MIQFECIQLNGAEMATGMFPYKFHTFQVFLFDAGGENETLQWTKQRRTQCLRHTWVEGYMPHAWLQRTPADPDSTVWGHYELPTAEDGSISDLLASTSPVLWIISVCRLPGLQVWGWTQVFTHGITGMHHDARLLVSFFHWLFRLVSAYLPEFEVNIGADAVIPGASSPSYSEHLFSTYWTEDGSISNVIWLST